MKQQFVAAGLLVALVFVAPTRAEILEQVLVKVNGDIITKTQLEQRQVAVLRQRLNNQVDADAMKNDEQLKKMLAEITPELLVNAVDELLLVQRGRELGLHLGDDQFKQVVANIRKEQGLEDQAKFEAALKQENMTMDDLRNQLERQMLIEQVQRQEVGSKLTITEEEARQYYAAHPEEFTDPASVTLREIFVEVPSDTKGVNVAQDEAAQKKAADARERLLKGEDFAKVASEVSDSTSKANGGLIGPFAHSDMSPQLQQLVDKMKPGDITPVIRTTKGYQVFKLESMTAKQLQPFDKVRDLIADKVAAQRTKIEMRKFLARLRDQALIEWKNDDLKKAYEKQLVADSEASSSQH
ncbi:MAG TPA: peptidyl-prolyl cis-trans isomerase [Vicinamibacterales bacterium]|nr:peptidyl-prolyl cis-trans isomerase [Vicinamibacterales bacterium]